MEKCLQCGREKWDPFGGDSALSRCVGSGDRSCLAVKHALAADRARIAAAVREEANATTDDSCRDADDERVSAVLARLLRVVEGG